MARPAHARKANPGRRYLRARPYLVPALVLWCLTLPHLGQGEWQRGDTGWYSAIAVQAWRTGSLWTLYADPGQPYFNKPPLLFWAQGLVMHALGTNVWTARLPTAIAATLAVLLTVGIAARFANRRVALASGFALATTYEFFRRSREMSLDMWQLVFLLGAAWLIAIGAARARRPLLWFALGGVPLGLALMTKPLVGLAVLPILAAWMAWSKQARLIPALFGTLAVALAVGAPWHASMALIHGREFLAQYFGAEIAARAAGGFAESSTSATTWWYYLALVASTCWPWLLFALLAVATLGRGRPLGRNPRAWRLALVWLVAWLVLISVFPDRRPRYALVLWPAIAWLAALWWMLEPWAWLRRATRGAGRFVVPVFIAIGVGAQLLPLRLHAPPDDAWPALIRWVRANAVEELWQGGISPHHASRLYLETGRWPIPTRNRWGESIASPPEGALLLYHVEDDPGPGPDERVEFQRGALTVTRR